MTTAFVDFPAQQQAKQQIADNVVKYTQMLIEALKDNYRQYSIRGHQRSAEKGDSVEYHLRKVEEMKSGKCDIDYVIETGKKYHKVVMIDGGSSRSVHCFIDKQTGEMYKSASWKSPAKGVRYDLRLIKDREWLFENADWSSGYLYAR
jgi:CRISPR/Cas system-associated protein endoribonuclease Cas2